MLKNNQKIFAFFAVFITLAIFSAFSARLFAQNIKQSKPAADEVIKDYLQKIGGKKQLSAVKNSIYEWNYLVKTNQDQQLRGAATTQMQAPAFWRADFKIIIDENTVSTENSKSVGTSGSSVWTINNQNEVSTVTEAEAKSIRLQAYLESTRLSNLKSAAIAVKLIGVENVRDEPAYVVELTARNGASVRYYFGVNSKLLIKTEDVARHVSRCFSDYRMVDNILEPHHVVEPCEGENADAIHVFELKKVLRNTNLSANLFEPPSTTENLDVAALLREVQTNQEKISQQQNEYSYLQKVTARGFDAKGNVQKQIVRTYEIYRTQSGFRATKLISENGVALTGERLAKEEQRVAEQLTKAEENFAKEQQKRAADPNYKPRSNQQNNRFGVISILLRMKEFVSPRRETFRNREAIVFDFRPLSNYRPQGMLEIFYNKMRGVVWIDAAEKRIVRLEAYVPDGIKVLGGLVGSLKPNTNMIYENARVSDKIWLPRLYENNIAYKSLFFGSEDSASVVEYSDYKRYSSEVKEYQVNKTSTQKDNQ